MDITGPISRRRLLVTAPALAVAAQQLATGRAHAAEAAAAPAAAPQADCARALSVRGADISFTLQEEAAGTTYSDNGRQGRVEEILARHGANYVRLRLWVDPPPGYSDLASSLRLARRAKKAGMKVLLDLHYSDFWADPAHQTTPAGWADLDLAALARKVERYTARVLADFAAQGTPVDMVQIGNEITGGMLWPLGKIYQDDGEHWTEFAALMQAGIAGARAGNPAGHRLAVMLHIDRGGDNAGSRYFFDHVLAAGVLDFDVIGESYYSFWHGSFADLRGNLNDLSLRYHRDLVVVETAYPWTLRNGDDLGNFISEIGQLPDAERYPPTPHGQAAYFERLRRVLREVPAGRGTGFFDWEPEWLPGVGWEPGAGNPNDNLTMFDHHGRALPSVRAFRRPA